MNIIYYYDSGTANGVRNLDPPIFATSSKSDFSNFGIPLTPSRPLVKTRTSSRTLGFMKLIGYSHYFYSSPVLHRLKRKHCYRLRVVICLALEHETIVADLLFLLRVILRSRLGYTCSIFFK